MSTSSIQSPISVLAGGNNLGIDFALKNNAEYTLLINNDATVEEKSFLVDMLHAKGDIISPLVKYKVDNQLIYDYGGRVDYLFGHNTHFHSPPSTPPDYIPASVFLSKPKSLKGWRVWMMAIFYIMKMLILFARQRNGLQTRFLSGSQYLSPSFFQYQQTR